MAKPIFELDIIDLYDKSVLYKELNDLGKMFNSKKFKEFIGNKCLKVLDTLMQNNLDTFNEHSVFDEKVEEYKKNCKYKIDEDYIIIYNETILTQEEMTWVSEKTKKNYPDGISIAHIIEYGTGLLGDSTPEDDWETNTNPNGIAHTRNGSWWHYSPDDENIHYTSGIEGRYIFNQMMEKVEKNFSTWVDEYIEKEM